MTQILRDSITPHITHVERVAVEAIRRGYLQIDADGSIWSVADRRGWGCHGSGSRLVPCPRKRVDRIHTKAKPYRVVHVYIDGRRLRVNAHRLVWQWFHGDIPSGMIVNHKDGDKGNNTPDNLELVTHAGNVRHAWETLGLVAKRGEDNPSALLSDADVIAMRTAYSEGVGIPDLMIRFGRDRSIIDSAVKGKNWKHIASASERLFCIGDTVGWHRQFRGVETSATGTIVAFVEAGEEPNDVAARIGLTMRNQPIGRVRDHRSYLVSVKLSRYRKAYLFWPPVSRITRLNAVPAPEVKS